MPLSSPLNSSLQTDALTLAIVLAGICAFALGLNDLARRWPAWRRLGVDAVTTACYGAIALLGVAVVLMIAGLRSLPIGQALFVAIAVWGAARGIAQVPSLWRWANDASGEELLRRAATGLAMTWTVLFWMDVFRSHVALPSEADGIAHTAYYLRILEAGVPTLGRVPIGFSNVFGVQLFDFYPTGTHAVLAMAAGFWGQWGVVTHAGVLKAAFTLTMSALPWALYWILGRLVPAMPWWLRAAVAIAAIPGFRFPIEAAHEGGASRLIAHLVMAPICADALLGRFDALRARAFAGGLLGAAFLLHPSVFIVFAAILVYSWLCDVVIERRSREWLSATGGLVIALVAGALLVAGLLRWNGSAAAVANPDVHVVTLPFAWSVLVGRWRDGWMTLFDRAYGMTWRMGVLLGLGLVALVAGHRTLGISKRVALFPLWMAAMVGAILASQAMSLPGIRLIGAAFYDETPRTIEPLFESIGLCLAVAVWSAWLVASGASISGRRRFGGLIGLAVLAAAVTYQVSRIGWVRQHVAHWDRVFHTPEIGQLEDLGAWIVRHTEPNAILFYKPFDSEIWEAWTDRRGIFMYGECHANHALGPCLAREALVARQVDVLSDRLNQPAAESRCLEPIDAFGRPAYFLIPVGASSERSMEICKDASLVISLDNRAVTRYHKPETLAR